MVRVFIIGGTGHVGGAVLDAIVKRYPDVNVDVLVRDSEKAAAVKKLYPKVNTVIGSLGDLSLLQESAKKTDIAIYGAPDITHEGSISALLKSLQTPVRSKKPYFIHTSGAALIWDNARGTPSERVWDDVADIAEIRALPAEYTHKLTDSLVRDAHNGVNVAIVAPTWIHGHSPSPIHPLPLTTPNLVSAIKTLGSVFTINGGENLIGFVNVEHLAEIYLALVDDALKGIRGEPTNPDCWGPDAYFFGVSEEITFRQFVTALAPGLHSAGFVSSTDVKQVDFYTAVKASAGDMSKPVAPDSWANHITVMYAVNMRVKGSRAEKLGIKDKTEGVEKTFPESVRRYLEMEKA